MAKFCPECSNPIRDGNMPFCPKCGAKLPITLPEVQPPVTQPVAIQQPAHPSWYIPPVTSASTSAQTPEQQPQGSTTESTTKEGSSTKWICCGGVILLVILTALFYGYFQSSNYFQNSSNTPRSIPLVETGNKMTALKIGDTAILSSEGASLAVKVINFTHRGNGSYGVGFEEKNVGQTAVTGRGVVRYVVTDWAGVEHDDKYDGYWTSIGDGLQFSSPFYPGDTLTEFMVNTFSDKAMQGKLTFDFSFGDQTASWIIKE